MARVNEQKLQINVEKWELDHKKNILTISHPKISECNKADHSVTFTRIKMPSKAASKLTSNKSSIRVDNLTPDATETDLIDYFSKFGHVKGARVVIDSFTGQCLGYGFVIFADGDAFKNGVLDVQHYLNGRRLTVHLELPSGDSRAPSKQSSTNSSNLRQNPPTENPTVDLESETSPRSESLAACPEDETSGPALEVHDHYSEVFAIAGQHSGVGDEAEMQ
nr:unnamed protein product [Spirometra erinaceieuropaei]